MENKFASLFKSRKFWAAVVGAVVVVANGLRPEGAALDEQTVLAFVLTIVGYIIGTGIEDAGNKAA